MFFQESKKRFDSDEAFKKRAYEKVVKLQHYDDEIVKAWNLICDISKKCEIKVVFYLYFYSDNQLVYDRLDIVIKDVGESFYQDKMISLVEDLKKTR